LAFGSGFGFAFCFACAFGFRDGWTGGVPTSPRLRSVMACLSYDIVKSVIQLFQISQNRLTDLSHGVVDRITFSMRKLQLLRGPQTRLRRPSVLGEIL
jgi:hypothetical protein